MDEVQDGKIKILWTDYIFKSWHEVTSLVVQSVSLIILYLLLERFIENKINEYWVVSILSDITSLDWIISLVLGLQIIHACYQIQAKNFSIKAYETLTIFLYLKYRFIDTEWIFYPYDRTITFFDSIPLFILLPKIISLVWFFRTLETSVTKKGVIDPDLPLNDSNPTDELQRGKFAQELVTVLKETRPSERALVIGINGGWGSGKSSLQYLINKSLSQHENRNSFYLINFNPWFYSQEKSLSHVYLNLVKQTIKSEQYVISKAVSQYAATILSSTESMIFSTRFLNDLKTERSLEQELQTVKSRIRNLKKTLLVIIDDLDRLSGDELIEVFRLIRIVGDFPNTIYILLYDKEYVKKAIHDKLSEHNSNIYIDKIVQVEYSIPESTPDNLRQLFVKHLSRSLKQAIPESEKEWSDEQVNDLIEVEIFNDTIKHIRDIKRFTNNFLLRYKSIHSNVSFNQFFLLELLRYKSPDLANIIFTRKDMFLKEIQGSGEFHQSEMPIIEDTFWTTLVANRNAQSILRKIASFKGDLNSISEPFNFPHYFTLTLQESFIAEGEFNDLMKVELNDDRKKKLKYWITDNKDMLIYRFRNYESFTSLDDFMIYTDHLAFASSFIMVTDKEVSDDDKWEQLPKIFINKYLKLTGDNQIDSKMLYSRTSKRLFEGENVSDVLRNIFRNNTSYSIKVDYADSPLAHGWKVFDGQTVDNLSSIFIPQSDKKNSKYMVFNAPTNFRFDYDFDHAPLFLRNMWLEFKPFESEEGFFYIKIKASKGSESKTFLIRPTEQPSKDLGRVSDDEYVRGLPVKVEGGWHQFELNMDEVFRASDFAVDGFELESIIGIAIKGKIGFGKFELY